MLKRVSCWRCGSAAAAARSTRRYCSDGCRQSAYPQRRSPKVWRRRAARPIPLRVPHPARATMKLDQAVVRPIPLSEARKAVEPCEPMCVAATYAFALFLEDKLASVVVFGAPPAGNLKPLGDQIALLRGVTLPWAPRNCGSALIRRAMRQLSPHVRQVVAYADATLSKTGAIYRAAGFARAGPSGGGRRVLVHYQGKVLSERSARYRFGTASASKLAALGLKMETAPRRMRFVALRDPRMLRRNTVPTT